MKAKKKRNKLNMDTCGSESKESPMFRKLKKSQGKFTIEDTIQ